TIADLLERDDAVVLVLALDRLPGDPLVRLLLGDLGRPLTPLAADLRDPLDVRVVELLNGLNSLHELRELLELRPLVVRLLYGNLNLNRIVDFRHRSSLRVCVRVKKGVCPGPVRPANRFGNLVRLAVALIERVFAAGVLGARLGKAAADHVADPDRGDERPSTNVTE